MTRAAKLVYEIAVIFGLCVGLVLGFETTASWLTSEDPLQPLLASGTFGNFSYVQYRHADPEHARAALVSYATFMQNMQQYAPDPVQNRDLVLVYARLALLADDTHNPVESQQWMAKVHALYAGSGHDHSDAEIKAGVRKLDAHLSP